jgi:hypothetical protein
MTMTRLALYCFNAAAIAAFLLLPITASAQSTAVVYVQFFNATAVPAGLYRHPTSEFSVGSLSLISPPPPNLTTLTALDFAPNGQDLYGINSFGALTPRGIARYDLQTGAAIGGTFREFSGFASGVFEPIGDFSIDPRTGTALLSTTTEAGAARLYQLDLASGALTLIGPLAAPVSDLAIDCSARLFGTLSANGQLVQINRQSAAVTAVGPPPSLAFRRNIDFDNRTGQLFAWAESQGAGQYVAFGSYTADGDYLPQNTATVVSAGAIANRCETTAVAVPVTHPLGLGVLLSVLLGFGLVAARQLRSAP